MSTHQDAESPTGEAASAATVNHDSIGWRLENTYAGLPEIFSAPAPPARFKKPQVSILNHALAEELGLDLRAASSDEAAALFAGQTLPPGAEPIAQAYAGHQFGGFTMLGDGRAILLGEHRTPDGQLVDIQLKGAGRTRFSRGGDGRAALGPMLREYIISEGMAALGIPTTRSLAVVTTGEKVVRETMKPGAVLTRVAASHIRVGTFQYLAARGDQTNLRRLADYAIDRHFPELSDAGDRHLSFFRAVVERQAELIARWQLVGFIHGVMNTDNMAISGETIDYGPCAFMNAYDPATVFSSIDHGGRYSYGNQPAIAQWNLARLAETLLPIFDGAPQRAVEEVTEVLHHFATHYEQRWLAGMRAKLGLSTSQAEDGELIESLLAWMQTAKVDFTNTFRDLSTASPPQGEKYASPGFQAWHAHWRARLQREGRDPAAAAAAMRQVNPAVIPRNHRVEEALAAAEEDNNLAPLHRLLAVLAAPYDVNPDSAPYQEAPADDCHYRTFCGT